jgi:hypothetical protein
MRGAILPLSRYVFMARCLVKHRDNFTFTFRARVSGRMGYDSRRVSFIVHTISLCCEDVAGCKGVLALLELDECDMMIDNG